MKKRSDYPEDDAYSIYVYLTNNRFISFSDIELYHFKSSRGQWPQTLLQINDFVPIVQYFKPVSFPPTNKSIEYKSSAKGFIEIKYLPELIQEKKLTNILEIIDNIDYLYDYFKSLPDFCKYFGSLPKYTYFSANYNSELKIPEELQNDIPVSIIRKGEYYNCTYEEGYKFYKMSVDRAVKEFNYKNLKSGYEKQK